MEILSLESVLNWLRSGCDSWAVICGLLAIVLALDRFGWAKPYVSGFVFPVSLLLFRKVSLYIPLSGTLSTEDQVIFWSTYAYVYFVLLLPTHIGFLFGIWAGVRDGHFRPEFLAVLPGIGFFVGSFHLIASTMLLPIDGWSHFVTPFLSHIGAVKLLLINPAFLVLVGIVLIIHLFFAIHRQSHNAQAINKLLLGSLVVCSLIQFCLQPWPLSQVRAALSVDESRPFETAQPSSETVPEIRNVLGHWIAGLSRTKQCEVNFLEGSEAQFDQDCKVRGSAANLAKQSRDWTPKFSGVEAIFWGGVVLGLLLFAGLIQKLVRKPRGDTNTVSATYHQPISSWRSIVPSVQKKALPLRKWPYLAAVIIALAFTLGIYVKSSLLTGAGVVGMSGLVFIFEYNFLMEGLVFYTLNTLVHAVGIRDRKGRRGLSRLADVALNRARSESTLMEFQPDQFLLALRAGDKTHRMDVPDLLQRGAQNSLAAHPACTILTRIDFLINGLNKLDSVELLPRDLWPKALNALVRSKFGEARRVATTCDGISRDTLFKFCCEDPEPAVWQAALERLERESLQERDAIRLARSKHAEVRIAAIKYLPRNAVLDLCYRDQFEEVRTNAWHKLEPQLTVDEGNELSQSSFGDVRLKVVRKGKLSPDRLKWLRWRDPDGDVRQQAFEQTPGKVGRLTAWRMLRSPYSDVRLRVVQSNNLSISRLAKIYDKDADEVVRQAAWRQLFKGLPVEEAETILENNRLILRPSVVQSSDFSRDRLVALCANDWQTAVREAAWEKLRTQLNPSEAVKLSCSLYGAVRLWAVQSRLLTREQLVELCRNDNYRPVALEASKILRQELTVDEAEKVSSSPISDIRVAAINSTLLTAKRLDELSRDPIVAVRQAARRQLVG